MQKSLHEKMHRFCTLHYRRNIKIGMFMVSLLMSSLSLAKAREIFHDIVVTLHRTSPFYGR